ncbi:MAG: translation initiation factor IF-2 [Candidatus Marinimicrobia bacterium]|nr:translation initiation factor IF-2 [Candidatus Neomarinimicrobiota bacterium]
MTDQVTKKRRIFQIAKELNISHTEIIEFLKREGFEASSHMSPVEQPVYERILGEFAKERVIIERHRKEQARNIATARLRETAAPKNRFDRILSLDEQRSIEKEEQDKARLAREAAELRSQEEERDRKKEEELKQLALEELKKSQQEEQSKRRERAKAAVSDVKGAARSAEPPPTKTKLKRVDMRAIASKVDQGRRKPVGRKAAGKLDEAKARTVDQTLRQTLASMGAKERRRRPSRKEREDLPETEASEDTHQRLKIHDFMSVAELASVMKVSAMEVISACMKLGIMVSINQRLDMPTLTIVAEDFGFDVDEDSILSDMLILEDMAAKETEAESVRRPPVVTVMGHVDHGKTTLLDNVRSSNVVAGESGGITQHIGAYEVTLSSGEHITFLDTPGHAAFTAMRARGAQITDIVVLIVAADDAVMPQTKEAIDHAKAAGVNLIVAINKIDKPEADVERVKRELSEHGVLVEDWGGKVQCAEISAKSGKGIPELMNKILLEAEMLDLTAVKDAPANGTVIESRLDRGLGAVATVLIQKGTLRRGDTFLSGNHSGRVRALQNERGMAVNEAYPSDPILIQGFAAVPQAGDRFIVFEDDKEAKRIGVERARIRQEMDRREKSVRTLDDISKEILEGAVRQLPILLKADVDGSLEALRDSLSGMSTEEVSVDVIHHAVGNVSENDVLLAKASSAVIIAFRVKASTGALELIKTEGVEIRNYDVIYDAVDEIKLALEGLLEPDKVETPLGVAEVRATFRVPKLGIIAGCYMKEGKAVREAYLRVTRNGELIHEGDVTSLRRFKDDVKEVQEGFECGIGVQGFTDFQEGDLLEIYEVKEVKRTLA